MSWDEVRRMSSLHLPMQELINSKSEDGFTALSLCAQGGHVKAVEYLLSQV